MVRHNAGAHAHRVIAPSKAAIVISMLIIFGVLVAAVMIAIFTA